MKKLFTVFKAPSADALARAMLEDAKRDLLTALARREQAALVAEYQRALVARLTRTVESGELV